MREEIAKLAFPVLTSGLRLKERLTSDELPDFRTAQVELQGLLLADAQAARWPDFGGEAMQGGGGGFGHDGGADRFLGIRYALVCWLDEIMLEDTPASWKSKWNEYKLEQTLYSTNERYEKFWTQAEQAARAGRTDALEAFYLCAMLGFRGKYLREPEPLRTKLREFQDQIDAGQGREWNGPVGGQAKSHVPPLQGEQRKQKMLFYAIVSLLVLIPVAMFTVIYLLRP